MGSTFIPSRCAVVDQHGPTTLIRGNMPLVGSDLHYALDEIEKASGVQVGERTFIEVPIIDNVGEREQFVPLLQAFGLDPADYPEKLWPWWQNESYQPNELRGRALTTEGRKLPGSLIWRPFEGLPPHTDPTPYLRKPGWDFCGFVNNIVDLMQQPQARVIYVHCQLGADRTGAFHIGYLMKAKKLTLQAALDVASKATSAGAPNSDYLRLVTAYAARAPR